MTVAYRLDIFYGVGTVENSMLIFLLMSMGLAVPTVVAKMRRRVPLLVYLCSIYIATALATSVFRSTSLSLDDLIPIGSLALISTGFYYFICRTADKRR